MFRILLSFILICCIPHVGFGQQFDSEKKLSEQLGIPAFEFAFKDDPIFKKLYPHHDNKGILIMRSPIHGEERLVLTGKFLGESSKSPYFILAAQKDTEGKWQKKALWNDLLCEQILGSAWLPHKQVVLVSFKPESDFYCVTIKWEKEQPVMKACTGAED